MEVNIKIQQLNLGTLYINATTFGDLDYPKVTTFFNTMTFFGLPFVNIYLSTLKMSIPKNIADIFELSDLTLKYHDDFLEIGLTPEFLPIQKRIDFDEIFKKPGEEKDTRIAQNYIKI